MLSMCFLISATHETIIQNFNNHGKDSFKKTFWKKENNGIHHVFLFPQSFSKVFNKITKDYIPNKFFSFV